MNLDTVRAALYTKCEADFIELPSCYAHVGEEEKHRVVRSYINLIASRKGKKINRTEVLGAVTRFYFG